MVQRTLVTAVTEPEAEALRLKLDQASFEWRSQPHARFSARGEGVVATCYASGKLVVQGLDPESFLLRHLGRQVTAPEPKPEINLPSGTITGSDECGKGDLFGPLIVVALRLEPDEAKKLAMGGVVDSKLISDERANHVGAALLERYKPAIARFEPLEYNRAYQRIGNLNAILTDLHAQALRGAAQPGDTVVVDQFGPVGRMERVLRGSPFRLIQIPRGERVTAVAAASTVARHLFLEALRELSLDAGVELPKGAGEPADRAAARLFALHGEAGMPRFAKMHFANANRIVGRR